MRLCTFAVILLFYTTAPAFSQDEAKWHPGHYVLYLDESITSVHKDRAALLKFERFVESLPREIVGVQGGAYWANLEPAKDKYDFSLIEEQLRICAKNKKYLFCTISDKSFGKHSNPAPEYLTSGPAYQDAILKFKDGGGMQICFWKPSVMERFNRLISELGRRFDKEPYFEGIEFVETALNVDSASAGITPESYIASLEERLRAAKKAFPRSIVLQETNWLPGANQKQMAEFFACCAKIGVGIGGPDLIPDSERAKERPRIPAYEFFEKYSGKIPLACDVQPTEYMGRDSSRFFGNLTPKGIYEMGVSTLRLNYIFWAACDWQNTNFTFTGDVIPYLKSVGWKINNGRPRSLSDK